MKANFEKYFNVVLKKKKLVLLVLVLLVIVLFIAAKFFVTPIDNTEIFATQNKIDNATETASTGAKNKNDNTLRNKARSRKVSGRITVDIYGAVSKEGVYNLEEGARLNDLLKIAGGLAREADLKAINRAVVLADQEKIYIPYKGENFPSAADSMSGTGGTSATTKTTGSDSEKVNLNTATVEQLKELNGIGDKKAEQIIQYREENGPFKDPKELTNVSGIGEKTFENLADQVTI